MGSEWRETSLADVAIRTRGTVSGPFGSSISKKLFVNAGVPVIRGNNLSLGTGGPRFHDEGFVFLTDDKADELASAECRPGDLVFTARGTIGQVGLIPKDAGFPRYILSANQLRLRPDPQIADSLYLYYWFSTPEMVAVMKGRNAGSALPNMNLGALRGLPVLLPPLQEQRAIAHILGSLDDRIELNRRMSQTLESMTSALFQSWFVDFDPVRAKAKGGDPSLPAPLADLFPGCFEVSAIGEIPMGWRVGPLNSVLVLQRGFDLPTPQRTSGAYPVLAASGPTGTHNTFMVRGPGVTTGRSGVLGKVFYVQEDFWPLNTSLWVKEYRHSLPAYAYHLLRRIPFGLFNAGSAVPTLNRNHVHDLPTLLPPMALIAAFEQSATAGLMRQHKCDEQAQMLGSLRDGLLRALMDPRDDGPRTLTWSQSGVRNEA